MSLDEQGGTESISIWLLALCGMTLIYLAWASFMSGLSECGGSYATTQTLGLSMLAGICIGLSSYVKLSKKIKAKLRILGGAVFITFSLATTTVFSAAGWTYYTQPSSLEVAAFEFWRALLGSHCE